MAGKLQNLNLATVACQIATYAIHGYGDGGAIGVEYNSDEKTISVGADGHVSASRTNDDVVFVTITVKESSKSCRDLWALYRAEKLAEDVGLPKPIMPVIIHDPINGDHVQDDDSTFVSVPAPAKGKEQTDRVFKLCLPNGKKRTILAGLVLI